MPLTSNSTLTVIYGSTVAIILSEISKIYPAALSTIFIPTLSFAAHQCISVHNKKPLVIFSQMAMSTGTFIFRTGALKEMMKKQSTTIYSN
jgi:hypothetical protein